MPHPSSPAVKILRLESLKQMSFHMPSEGIYILQNSDGQKTTYKI